MPSATIKPRSSSVSQSLQDLMEDQVVKPVFDLDSISSLWPVDDDPDELLRFIAAERKRRREKENC